MLEYNLISPGEETVRISAVAENIRDEWRYSKFAVVVTGRGNEVAGEVRFGEEAQKNRIRCSDLQETIEFLSAKRSRLLAATE